MASNEAKNELLVMVLADLAGICKKLADNSAVPEKLRVDARNLGEESKIVFVWNPMVTNRQSYQSPCPTEFNFDSTATLGIYLVSPLLFFN